MISTCIDPLIQTRFGMKCLNIQEFWFKIGQICRMFVLFSVNEKSKRQVLDRKKISGSTPKIEGVKICSQKDIKTGIQWNANSCNQIISTWNLIGRSKAGCIMPQSASHTFRGKNTVGTFDAKNISKKIMFQLMIFELLKIKYLTSSNLLESTNEQIYSCSNVNKKLASSTNNDCGTKHMCVS